MEAGSRLSGLLLNLYIGYLVVFFIYKFGLCALNRFIPFISMGYCAESEIVSKVAGL